MKLVKPGFTIDMDGLTPSQILTKLERIGRLSHQSEDKMTEGSAEKFISKWAIQHGHESILRHHSITVRIVCNRAVSHQLVRHGLAHFLQESQRYCCYKGHVTFVVPQWANIESGQFTREQDIKLIPPSNGARVWVRSMFNAEESYHDLLACGRPAEEARGVLPNDAKTELDLTANLEEWRHIFKARTSKHTDPAAREIMAPMLDQFTYLLPAIFSDIIPFRG